MDLERTANGLLLRDFASDLDDVDDDDDEDVDDELDDLRDFRRVGGGVVDDDDE